MDAPTSSPSSRLRIGSSGLRAAVMPETLTLWLLIGLELLAQVSLRRWFKRHHGG